MGKQNYQTVFWKTRQSALLLSLSLFIGLSIRIYNLGSHNLWFDEFYSTLYLKYPIFSGQAYSFIFRRFLFSQHLYHILLRLWVIFFGESEFALRSLSMLFGVLSIPLIYKLGKSFFNTVVGLISAFILSISPIHIWYSQEARGYSLSTFLVMLLVYIFISALKKNNIHLWIGFIVSSILALYTSYFSFFIIILVGILFIFKSYRPLLKHYLASLWFILLAFLPFSPIFFKLIIGIKNSFWIPKPHLNSITLTFENFNVGYNATPNIYFFTFIIFSLLFILCIKCWWQEKREELISLISFIFIPIIFTFLISQIVPIYLDRQLMLFSPFYYIVLAAGLTKIKLPIIKTAAYLSISVPILFCLYNYFSYRMPLSQYHHFGAYVKKPVKPAADYINKMFQEGDAIGMSEPSSVSLFYYYTMPKIISREKINIFSFGIESQLSIYWKNYWTYRRQQKEQIEKESGVGITGFYGYTERVIRHPVRLDDERSVKEFEKELERYGVKRLWLISSSWVRDGILDPHEYAVRQWIRTYYFLLDSKEFDGIFVDLYRRKIN